MEIVALHPLVFTTLFGAAATYIFAAQKGFQSTTPFLKRMAPGHSDLFYHRVDFLVGTLCGTAIGTIFFAPATAPEALAAGASWTGAVNVLFSEGKQE